MNNASCQESANKLIGSRRCEARLAGLSSATMRLLRSLGRLAAKPVACAARLKPALRHTSFTVCTASTTLYLSESKASPEVCVVHTCLDLEAVPAQWAITLREWQHTVFSTRPKLSNLGLLYRMLQDSQASLRAVLAQCGGPRDLRARGHWQRKQRP